MQDFRFTVTYETHEVGVTGWCNEIKGITADGETKEDVRKTLYKLLRIKFEIQKSEAGKRTSRKYKTYTEDIAEVQYSNAVA